MVIDFEKARKERQDQEIDKKIEEYAEKLRLILDYTDEILDDIELSDINWFNAKEYQKEKIEAISKIGLFMETYAGWSRE
jgi:hypothetical protein